MKALLMLVAIFFLSVTDVLSEPEEAVVIGFDYEGAYSHSVIVLFSETPDFKDYRGQFDLNHNGVVKINIDAFEHGKTYYFTTVALKSGNEIIPSPKISTFVIPF